MARKHPVEAPEDGPMILPLPLVVKTGLTGSEYAQQHKDRSQWFRDRGIDPGDWRAVYPILKASWAAHGIPSALERARLRSNAENRQHPERGGTSR